MKDSPLQVLLIDSNPLELECTRALLLDDNSASLLLDTCLTVPDALTRLHTRPVDVVLADLPVPDDLLPLRRHAPAIPLVVLTRSADDAFAMQAIAQGAQDCLRKGQVTAAQLRSALHCAVARQRAGTATHNKRQQEMAQLSDMATGFVELSPDEDIFHYIGERLQELVSHGVVCIMSHDESENVNRVRHIFGIDNYLDALVRILGTLPIGMCFTPTEEVKLGIASGKLVRIDNVYELSLHKIPLQACRMIEKLLDIGEIYGIGFTRKGGIFGDAAIILRRGETLTNAHTIEMFVNLASVALQRWRAEKELRAISLHDELTGLYNRRGFITMAEQQMKLAQRTRHSMILLYADLDNLKSINDSFDHATGDRALAEVGELFRETFRTSDIIARLCGDEFAVLVIDGKHEDAQRLTTRLHKHVATANTTAQRPYTLSISVGAATYSPHAPRGLEELLSEADHAMYVEKRLKKMSVG